MTRIERSIVIDRSQKDVFEFVQEPANDERWQTTVVETSVLTPGPMGVGVRVAQTRRFLGVRFETTFEVTEFEPHRRSAVRTVAGPIPAVGRYLVAREGDSARLTATIELEAHGLFSLAEPVFARMAARELETNLGHLKDIVEADQPAVASRS